MSIVLFLLVDSIELRKAERTSAWFQEARTRFPLLHFLNDERFTIPSALVCVTLAQPTSGLGIEAQQQAVDDHLRSILHTLIAVFTEIESGKRNDRPELAKALGECRLRKATLIIAELDRLARNVHFASGLMGSNLDFVAVDFPQANRLTVHILAAVAEHEAHMISERTKAALRAAKQRGVRLGGDRGNRAICPP